MLSRTEAAESSVFLYNRRENQIVNATRRTAARDRKREVSSKGATVKQRPPAIVFENVDYYIEDDREITAGLKGDFVA